MACTGSKAPAAAGADTQAATVKADDFVSPDLAFLNVHGPVHILKTEAIEYEFSPEGVLLAVNGRDPFQEPTREIDDDGVFHDILGYERNEQGYISSVSSIEGCTEFIWADGRIVSETSAGEGMVGTLVYTFNADGTVQSFTEAWSSEDAEEPGEEIVTTYSDYQQDGHGNWVSRVYHIGEVTSSESRTISYYNE